MAAFVATPKLPWDITEGGVIKLKDTTVTMQQLVNGRVTFGVINNHGETVTGRVVQYPSDQKYYIQADGELLWQIDDISQATDTLEISPSQTVQSGFTLADVHVNNLPVEFGYYLDGTTAYLAVKMMDDSVKVIESDGECFTGSEQGSYAAFAYYPSPINSGDAIAFAGAVDKSLAPIETISSSIIAENGKWYVEVSGVRFELDLIPEDTSPLRVNTRVDFQNLVCSPALPWNDQSTNTKIWFADEITEQDLRDGKLVMYATNEQYGERQLTITVSSSISIYQGGLILGNILRPISGHVINIEMQAGAANWPITKIERV